jgi:hypothetical protein
VEHLADKFDLWWLVRILLLELHHQSERAVFERRIRRADDDGVPDVESVSVIRADFGGARATAYQVMTLSGTGEAETPAGGSVCIRFRVVSLTDSV